MIDYNLLSGMPKRTPSNIAGGFTEGLQQGRTTKLGNTIQKEALSNNPDMNQILAGYSQIDPKGAMEQLYTQDRYKKEADAKMEAALLKSQQGKTPEAIRFKLASLLNALNGRISRADAGDPSLPALQKLADKVQEQMASDNPSIQMAYSLEQIVGGLPDEDGTTGTTVTPAVVAGAETLAPIDGATTPVGTKAVGDAPIEKPYKPKPGTSFNNDGQIIKNNKISTTPTDYFNLADEDGAKKPVLHPGINALNLPENVKTAFAENKNKWEKTNNTAKAGRIKAARSKKASGIVNRIAAQIPKVAANLRDQAEAIRSLKDFYTEGNYSLANFTRLKKTMADGRMTDSDVGLALGLDAVEGVWQNALSVISGDKAGIDKLNSKDGARKAINLAVEAYNTRLKAASAPKFGGEYAEEAQRDWVDNSYGTQFGGLVALSPVSGGAPVKPAGITPRSTPKPETTSTGTGWKTVDDDELNAMFGITN